MKKMKKLVAMTLAALMFLGGIAISPQKAEAAGNNTYDAWGFFEWVKVKYPNQKRDAELAIQHLNDYPQGFQRGNENDASSIKNMKQSLELIKEGNRLRVTDDNQPGLQNLKVSHQAMAIAISNAANSNLYRGKGKSHLQHFNVSENLAWGKSSLFPRWYDKEKALYDKGNKNHLQIGHYLNIIKPKYSVTGFGISVLPDDDYGRTASQVFQYKGQLGQEFTVDQYTSILNEYIKEKTSKPKNNKVQKKEENKKLQNNNHKQNTNNKPNKQIDKAKLKELRRVVDKNKKIVKTFRWIQEHMPQTFKRYSKELDKIATRCEAKIQRAEEILYRYGM